jgi:hypothetical protein
MPLRCSLAIVSIRIYKPAAPLALKMRKDFVRALFTHRNSDDSIFGIKAVVVGVGLRFLRRFVIGRVKGLAKIAVWSQSVRVWSLMSLV